MELRSFEKPYVAEAEFIKLGVWRTAIDACGQALIPTPLEYTSHSESNACGRIFGIFDIFALLLFAEGDIIVNESTQSLNLSTDDVEVGCCLVFSPTKNHRAMLAWPLCI